MIIAIRRYLKGPGFKAIIWLTLIAVAGFWGLPNFFKRVSHGGSGGPSVATVNGAEISHQEYNRVVNIQQEFLQRLKNQYGQYADLFIQAMGLNADPKALALDILVREALINGAVDTLHINITPGYIESRLGNPEVVQKQLAQILPPQVFDPMGGVNPAALNQYLIREKMSNEDLNELIRDSMARELVLELVGGAAYVPQWAIQEQCVIDFAKKHFSVMTLEFDPVLKNELNTTIADNEIKKFFETQNSLSKRYWTTEKRQGTIWTFDAKKFGVTVDDNDIESYYNDNRGQKFVSVPVKIEARTIVFKGTDQATFDKAMKIRQELLANPDSFASKAKEVSENKESAKNGGLVPFFSKGSYDKRFEKAVYLLKNDNDISEPVVTDRGTELVQRVAKKPAEFKPIDAVKNEIKELLVLRKFEEEFSEAISSLIDQNNEAAFQKFVEMHGATKGSLSAEQGDTPKAAKALFGLHEKGSMTFFYDNNTAVVVKLDQTHKREIPTLESVRSTVIHDLHKERAEKAFNKLVKETEAKAVETPLATLAKSTGGSVNTVDWLGHEDKETLDALKKKDVPVDLLTKLEKVGSIASEVGQKSAHIVRLDAIESLDAKTCQDKQQEVRNKLDHEASAYFVEGFVASLYRNATIKTSESMANTEQEDDYTPQEDYL